MTDKEVIENIKNIARIELGKIIKFLSNPQNGIDDNSLAGNILANKLEFVNNILYLANNRCPIDEITELKVIK